MQSATCLRVDRPKIDCSEWLSLLFLTVASQFITFRTNDRIVSANGISLENVEYATAVQVLRDSGNTVTLVVKRRVPSMQGNYQQAGPSAMGNHQHQHSLSSMGLTNGSQQIKVVLNKASKKEDFGLVLGCRLFIKEISSKMREQLNASGYTLQEGDIVTRVHNTNCHDAMSIKEAKKIIDGCKERLNLAVVRDPNAGATPSSTGNNNVSLYSHTQQLSNCSNVEDNFNSSAYSTQNLYVQPPTRPSLSTLLDDKCNLTPRGRSRGPLTDISLTQLDRPATPPGASGHSRSRSGIDEPPRPPPPRGEDYYGTRRMGAETSEPRYITFQKEGSVGIRLTGGNEVGIFVTAVQQNSPASMQGLVPGDKLLKVNDMDMNGVTREEAVLFLLSLQDRIDLIVQYCKEEYENVTQNQRGDSFHIKTHFHYDSPTKDQLSFRAGDVFRVIDTLHNGVVGSWQVMRIGRGHQELQRGIIPNKARAEELATAQFNASKKELNASESRVSFFRRKRSNHRRSKSLSRENWDDVVFSDAISKFPAYERVVLRHPGFVRPVVLFGPVADLARERLIKDFSDKFTAPLQDDDKSSSKCGIVRLSNIRDIMDRGKHALLDITPNAVDRLNYAQFYPIVIFFKADTKHTIKQLRQGIPKSAHKSSKKLFEQSQKLDRVWSHVFSTSINLNDPDTWYRKVRETIEKQQAGAVWMSETKVRLSCPRCYRCWQLGTAPATLIPSMLLIKTENLDFGGSRKAQLIQNHFFTFIFFFFNFCERPNSQKTVFFVLFKLFPHKNSNNWLETNPQRSHDSPPTFFSPSCHHHVPTLAATRAGVSILRLALSLTIKSPATQCPFRPPSIISSFRFVIVTATSESRPRVCRICTRSPLIGPQSTTITTRPRDTEH